MKMKRNRLSLVIIGMILVVVAVSYVSGILVIDNSSSDAQVSSIEKGLVGHWKLNGDNYNSATARVTDSSAYSNHGTNSGAVLATGRMGESEGVMDFDGVNDYVKTDEVIVTNPSELTNDFVITLLLTSHLGSVKEYTPKINDAKLAT